MIRVSDVFAVDELGSTEQIQEIDRSNMQQYLEQLGPYTLAANFTVDILGDADTRPDCWGRAGAQEFRITFKVPDGYRVRIMHVSGDCTSWFRETTNKKAGVLYGLQTTAPDGSARADFAADNCFVYTQDVVGDAGSRIPLNDDVDVLLEDDNVLRVKVASWLNETEQAMHIEPTLVLRYQFVKLA